MECLMREAQELNFRHRHHPPDSKAQRRADDGALGQWHVNDSFRAETIFQPARHSKDATKLSNVHPQENHPFVSRHLVDESRLNGFED
jgi:hypothetical protein